MAYLLVLGVGLAAGTISGIIGTGASIMLVPVLVLAFGPKQAAPIMAVPAVMGFRTGVVVSTGALSVPAFTSYLVVTGGFSATEASTSLAVYVSKVVTF